MTSTSDRIVHVALEETLGGRRPPHVAKAVAARLAAQPGTAPALPDAPAKSVSRWRGMRRFAGASLAAACAIAGLALIWFGEKPQAPSSAPNDNLEAKNDPRDKSVPHVPLDSEQSPEDEKDGWSDGKPPLLNLYQEFAELPFRPLTTASMALQVPPGQFRIQILPSVEPEETLTILDALVRRTGEERSVRVIDLTLPLDHFSLEAAGKIAALQYVRHLSLPSQTSDAGAAPEAIKALAALPDLKILDYACNLKRPGRVCGVLSEDVAAAMAQLPALEHMKLTYFKDYGERSVPDDNAEAASIAALGQGLGDRLRSLEIFDAELSNPAIAQLASFQKLEYLSLGSCSSFSDDGLLKFADCPALKALDIGGADGWRSDRLTKLLSYLRDMRRLSLTNCMQLDDNAIADLVEASPNLSFLDLMSNDGLTDEALRHLSSLQRLSWLSLAQCGGCTNEGMKYVSQIGSLTHLDLSGWVGQTGPQGLQRKWDAFIDDEGVKTLAQGLYVLTHIDLSGTQITSKALRYLHTERSPDSSNSLLGLNISSCWQLKDDALGEVLKFGGLRRLDINGCRFSQEAMLKLSALENLQELYAKGSMGAKLLTDETEQTLRAAMPWCRIYTS